MTSLSVLNYSMSEYPFCSTVADIFELTNLMLLHQRAKEKYEIAAPGKDQGTEFHKRFYTNCEASFLPLYERFVREVAGPLTFGDKPFLFQRIPTFRVQLPDNKAVGGVSHRDRDYNHPPEEINFLVPLTSMIGANSLFVESEEGLRDFRMLELHPGQFLVFDGANLEHGNVANSSGWTRVSFDFRLLRESDAEKLTGKRSVAHGLSFEAGSYYGSSRDL